MGLSAWLIVRARIWVSFRLVRLAQLINPGLMGAIMDMTVDIPGIVEVIRNDRDKWWASK